MTSADRLQLLADILHGDLQVDVDQCDHSNSDKSDRSSEGHESGGDEAEHDDDEGDEDFDARDSDSGSDKKRRRSCAPCEATTKRARSMPSTATARQPSVQSLINAMRDVYAEFASNEQLPNIKQFRSVMTRALALLCAMKDVLNEDVVQGGVMSTEVVDMHQLVWSRLTSRHVTVITAHRCPDILPLG